MKEKHKAMLNFEEGVQKNEFSFGNYRLIAKVPTLFEESKIFLKRFEIFKKFLANDEDFRNYFSDITVKELKLNDEGKPEIVDVPFDTKKQDHIEHVFNNYLGEEYRELINRLSYLDVVVEKIYKGEEELHGKFSDLFFFQPTSGLHLREIFNLSEEIINWINSVNEVDPFLSKN